MKIIGLLGGMSWESTLSYYRIINEEIGSRLGGLHSAKIILYSFNFHEIEQLQSQANWEEAGHMLGRAAQALERAGAGFLILCTNTMHKVASRIEGACSIPLLHIADATADSIKESNISKVGLLGTRFTMEEEFYVGRLREKHGIDVLVPPTESREQVHRIIYGELCIGQIKEESRKIYCQIIQELIEGGAQGVVLGCTEISLLVSNEDSAVPVFDTTKIHAVKAVDWSLNNLG